MMNKRDYEIIAGGLVNGILDTEEDSAPKLMENVIHHMADALKISDPSFNKQAFMAYVYQGVKFGGPSKLPKGISWRFKKR